MGTFDGPGLRLVVFLQGCNFRCLYCANPDTIAGKGGTPTPPEEIVRMAMSQRPFFGKRGGVTFSGGEPTFQIVVNEDDESFDFETESTIYLGECFSDDELNELLEKNLAHIIRIKEEYKTNL